MLDLDALRARHEQLQALEHEQKVGAQQLADRLAETRGRRLEVEYLIKSLLVDESAAAAKAATQEQKTASD